MNAKLVGQDETHDLWQTESGTLLATSRVRDDYPPPIREAMIRRRLVILTGICPCGAVPRRVEDGFAIEHERSCVAADDWLEPAFMAYQAGQPLPPLDDRGDEVVEPTPAMPAVDTPADLPPELAPSWRASCTRHHGADVLWKRELRSLIAYVAHHPSVFD